MLRRWAWRIVILAFFAGAVTVYQYRTTIHYGFDYDDYHFVRPYPVSELQKTFHGPWDASGIEVPFYRPLTICFFAARFALMGLNSDAYHCLSLAMFGLAALLLGVFISQLSDSLATAILSTIIFGIHPGMPYSAVAWITNQMHLLELLGVFLGAIWWHFVRRRSIGWWIPLIILQLLLLAVKEDAVMLLPFLVTAHVASRWTTERDLPMPPLGFLACATISIAGMLAFRQSVLHGIGGYRLPPLERGWSNLTRGLLGTFRLVPAKRPFQLQASWFVTLLPLVSLAGWRWVPASARIVTLVGIGLSILFDLPFVFVVKAEQLHLVATGAALVLAGSIAGAWTLAKRRLLRAGVAVVALWGLLSMSSVTREITHDFEPFGAIVLDHDRLAQGWAAVPIELRDYLRNKSVAGGRQTLSANPADALDLVSFGTYGPEKNSAGIEYRWMSGADTRFLVGRKVRIITVPLRHEIGPFGEPASVSIFVDGRLLDSLALTDDRWHYSTLAFNKGNTPRLWRMHEVRITIDHPWIPARLIPGSTDTRILGLQIGLLQIH